MKTGRYSLSQLLDNDNVNQIIIPEMQRDYVWTVNNVNGLLESIFSNYDSKEKLNLTITDAGKALDTNSVNYLTKEFERLRFNTRIGFIYAYYDATDSSSLYLIDGQQRVTTLFLLLLALYANAATHKESYRREFIERFMKEERPKLDYKVREGAHRFLVDFINFVLKNGKASFKENSERYYSLYDNDATVKSILTNYGFIDNRLKEHILTTGEGADVLDRIEDFRDYIENFIEFNYFDTGLSRQGEKLYLYMNSRGEQLSGQEMIRPKIIERCPDNMKLEVGSKWEEWQHFFWKKRGDNENADPGFQGFLKVAVILHQEVFKDSDIKLKPKEKKSDGTDQSPREVRQSYISDKNNYWINQYIKDNESFDYDWLNKIFEAYERISKIYDAYDIKPIRQKNWRSLPTMDNIQYISLCGMAMLAYKFPRISDESPGVSDENLYRFGMYLLNRSDDSKNGYTIAVIRAMELAESMKDGKIDDCRRIGDLTLDNLKNMDYSKSIMWKHIMDEKWEQAFWEIVNNMELNRFFDGNQDGLFRVWNEGQGDDVEEFKAFTAAFKDRFFSKRNGEDGRELRKNLLQLGDISINGGNPTNNLRDKMDQWQLPTIKPDKNVNEWRDIFQDPREHNGWYAPADIRKVVRKYVNGETDSSSTVGYLKAIANGIGYMSPQYYKYLWKKRDDDGEYLYPHIVLVQSCVPKWHSTVELPAYILRTHVDGSWNWCDSENQVNNFCVLDFDITDEGFSNLGPGQGRYVIDMVYHWNSGKPYWCIYLANRKPDEDISVWESLRDDASIFDTNYNSEDRRLKFLEEFHDTEGYDNDGMLKSISDIVAWIEPIKVKLETRIKELRKLSSDVGINEPIDHAN